MPRLDETKQRAEDRNRVATDDRERVRSREEEQFVGAFTREVERRVAEQNIAVQKYLDLATNPGDLPKFFADTGTDSIEGPQDLGPYVNPIAYTDDLHESQLLQATEEAVAAGDGVNIPQSFWMSLEAEDIELLGAYIHVEPEEVQEIVEKMLEYEAWKEMNAQIARMVKERFEQHERMNNATSFWSMFANAAVIGGVGNRGREVPAFDWDEETEKIMKEAGFATEPEPDAEQLRFIRVEAEARLKAMVESGGVSVGGVSIAGPSFLPPNMDEVMSAMGIDEGETPTLEQISNVIRGDMGLLRTDWKTFDNRSWMHRSFEGALGAVGSGITWAVHGVGNMLAFAEDDLNIDISFGKGFSLSDYVRGQEQGELDKARAKVVAEQLVTDEERIRDVVRFSARAALPEFKKDEPEAWSTFVDAAGGDEVMAAGFYAFELGQSVTAEDQVIQDFLADTRDEHAQALEDLDDFNFSIGDQFLSWMATYGKNVPLRLATTFTLFITDDMVKSAGWGEKWHVAQTIGETYDFSPAAALGIDGTLQGLMLDLGGGIAFDPITYFFVGRSALSTSLPKTAAQAARVSKSHTMNKMARNIVEVANASDAGVGALRHLIAWLDDVAVMDILEIAGYTNQKLPFARWRSNKLGSKAGRMERSIVDDMLPNLDELLDLKGVTAEAVTKMEDSLLVNGFEDAIEITFSRGDGLLTVTDGAVRLKAAQNLALKNLPVRIRIADDVAFATTKIPGLSLEVSARFAKVAQEGLQVSKGLAADAEVIMTLIHTVSKSAIRGVKETGSRMTTYVDDAGRSFTIYRVSRGSGEWGAGQQSKYYALADDTDELVSAMWYHEPGPITPGSVQELMTHPGTISTATKEGFQGQGHMTRIWDDAAGFERVHPMMLAGKSETTSQLASDFAQSYARRGMRDAAPHTADGRLGVHIDDLLLEGEELGINLAKVGEGQQGVLGQSNDVFLRPAKVLPDRMVRGVIDDQAIIDIIHESIVKRGVTPHGSTFGAQQRWWNGNMREKMRSTGPGRWLEEQVGQFGTTRNHNLTGVQAVNDAIHSIWRIAGRHMGLYDDLIQKLTDAQIRGGRARFNNAKISAELRQPLARIREIDNLIGSTTDDIARAAKEAAPPAREFGKGLPDEATRAADQARREAVAESAASKARAERLAVDEGILASRADLLTERLALEKQTSPIMRQLEDRIAAETSLGKVVEEVLEEAWLRFNREAIASKKGWRKFVNDDGIVPWEILRKGRALTDDEVRVAGEQAKTMVTKTMRDEMKASGNLEAAERAVAGIMDEPVTWQAPISELELLAATSWSGRRYSIALQSIGVGRMREGALTLQKWWIYDKVGRPSTASVVAFDEILRFFEAGRFEQGFGRWARDRAIFLEARLKSGRGPIGMFKRGSVQAGSKNLSAKSQARIQALSNKERLSIQAERAMIDELGLGYDDILPKDIDYLDAARRYTGGFLQRQEFRAFLRGKEAFYQFFDSEQGLIMQKAAALQKRSTTGTQAVVNVSVEDMYQGWRAWYASMLSQAEKKGMLAEVQEAFVATAKQIDEGAGGRLLNLPDFVFDNLGPVRGIRHTKPGQKNPISYGMDRWFKTVFDGTINARRGFVAEMARETERARLYQLYSSQGLKVMSDVEAESLLGLQGMANAMGGGARQFMQKAALDSGIILKSFMDDLIERAVQRTTADMLYNFQNGSRWGARARAIFPFAKPWADMWAYWGRNVLRKPVTRGWVQNSRIPFLRKTLEALPINPKPAAMMSRLAATDFEIDQDFFGKRIRADFSPLFFLPTGGTNPFGVLIPGLGYVPMHILDQVADLVPDADSPLGFRHLDPIEDATEYTNRMEMISEWIPGLGYQIGASIPEAALGGGVISSLLNISNSVLSWQKGDTAFDAINWLQDPQTALEINQQVVDMIADDPDFFTNLFKLETYDKARDEVYGLSELALKNVYGAEAIQATTRFLFPISAKLDIGQASSNELWFKAVDQFGEILDPTGRIKTVDLRDPKAVSAFANYARGNFFDLDLETQDLLILQNNHLAVNTVGSWEWTDEAAAQNIPGVEDGYRTPVNLDLHRSYKDQGIIRPVTPVVYTNRIIGRVERAVVRSNQRMYTLAAESINDWLWETKVPDDLKDDLHDLIHDPSSDQFKLAEFAELYGYHNSRDLWENWSEVEERYEKFLAKERGIKIGSKEYKALQKAVNIPGDQKAWGTKWKSLDDEDQSKRFKGVTFEVEDLTPEMRVQAAALGIVLAPEMTGLDIFVQIQENISQLTQPAYAQGATAYTTWQEGRNNVRDGARDPISRAIQNPHLDADWRTDLENFMTRTANNLEFLYDTVGDIPMADAQRVVDEFEALRIRDGGGGNSQTSGIDWDGTWRLLFERTYGARDWEPPKPAEPKPNMFSNTMNLISETTTPFDVRVVDGDTLNFKFGPGDAQRHQVRLLGVNSREYGFDTPGAEEDANRLRDFIYEGVLNGDTIYFVRDPDLFGNTDNFGRMLAWLWVGDTPFYFPSEMIRSITPSESDR